MWPGLSARVRCRVIASWERRRGCKALTVERRYGEREAMGRESEASVEDAFFELVSDQLDFRLSLVIRQELLGAFLRKELGPCLFIPYSNKLKNLEGRRRRLRTLASSSCLRFVGLKHNLFSSSTVHYAKATLTRLCEPRFRLGSRQKTITGPASALYVRFCSRTDYPRRALPS